MGTLAEALQAQAQRLFNAAGRSKRRVRQARTMIREAERLSAEREAQG